MEYIYNNYLNLFQTNFHFFFSHFSPYVHAHGSELSWVGRILQGKFMGFVAKSKRASTPERHTKVLGTLTLEPGIVRWRFGAQIQDSKLKTVGCELQSLAPPWRIQNYFVRLQSSQPIDVSILKLLWYVFHTLSCLFNDLGT